MAYVENLGGKNQQKSFWNKLSDCIKVAGYKVNVQKSTLYTINEQVEFEIKNITNHISTSKMKQLGINLTSSRCTRSTWGKFKNSDERYQRRTT